MDLVLKNPIPLQTLAWCHCGFCSCIFICLPFLKPLFSYSWLSVDIWSCSISLTLLPFFFKSSSSNIWIWSNYCKFSYKKINENNLWQRKTDFFAASAASPATNVRISQVLIRNKLEKNSTIKFFSNGL